MISPLPNPLHGQRHAIVIGANGSIASGLAPLIAPEAHDAPRMATVLASPACGFQVQLFLGEQALMQPIRDAIEARMQAGTIDDSLIIYFAGHGTITQTAEGPDVVLVTTDTTLDTIMDHPLTCLRVGWLKTVLCGNTQTYPIGHVVVILDCCASGMIGQLGNQPLIGDPPDFRRMLISTYTTHPAYEWNRTSLYTYHLLNALEGQAVDRFGAVTMELVHQYCSDKLAGTGQRCGLDGWDYTGRWQFAWYDLHRPKVVYAAQQVESDRLLNLRLEDFVGRVAELAAIREHIEAMRPTGGYVLIKAAAGEGKSSSIAKLIQEAGIATTPHHFIALTTGREYQLGLLRAVVAQLILKHHLTVSYFPEESYPAMKAEFARILDDLAKQGIQETIYLDGLDQLQPEIDGSRDLSFLPQQPPPGIVIVLGSRPDETLKPLEILHRVDYDLPPLSEDDALELWRSVQPGVADGLFHDLYTALNGNALFVHLAADTMRDQSIADTTSLIRQIEQNPGNLFGITLGRIKRLPLSKWDVVWKPMLALLLVAQEPLRLDVLGDLLGHDHDTMQDAVWVLGGLVSQGIDQRVALHHLLFRDYLAVSVFNQREVKRWQQQLADWCADDLGSIWTDHGDPIEQARRMYARYHYVTHLALAENWPTLWQVLDAGDYGEQKTRFDPSTRLYALDLDRGRESTITAGKSTEEHIQNLPRLWKYSLLRTSLTSRMDQWPDEAFEVLAMLGRTHEVLERVGLLSNYYRQIRILSNIIQWYDFHQRISIVVRIKHIRLNVHPNFEVYVLADIAKAVFAIGEHSDAISLIKQAIHIARSIISYRHRIKVFNYIVNAIIIIGDNDLTTTILDEMINITKDINITKEISNPIDELNAIARNHLYVNKNIFTGIIQFNTKELNRLINYLAGCIFHLGNVNLSKKIIDYSIIMDKSIDLWEKDFHLSGIDILRSRFKLFARALSNLHYIIKNLHNNSNNIITIIKNIENHYNNFMIIHNNEVNKFIDIEIKKRIYPIIKYEIVDIIESVWKYYISYNYSNSINTIINIFLPYVDICDIDEVSNSIENTEIKKNILIDIIKFITITDNHEEIHNINKKIFTNIEIFDIYQSNINVKALLAKSYASIGNYQKTNILIGEIIEKSKINDQFMYYRNLNFAIAAKRAISINDFSNATTIAHLITPPELRSIVLLYLANITNTLGNNDQSSNFTNLAIVNAESINNNSVRKNILAFIAKASTNTKSFGINQWFVRFWDNIDSRLARSTFDRLIENAQFSDVYFDNVMITFVTSALVNDYGWFETNYERIIARIQSMWYVKSHEEVWDWIPLVIPLLKDYSWLGTAILEEEAWVNEQLKRLG